MQSASLGHDQGGLSPCQASRSPEHVVLTVAVSGGLGVEHRTRFRGWSLNKKVIVGRARHTLLCDANKLMREAGVRHFPGKASEASCPPQSGALRSRRALAITETELKLIAALASMGLSSQPKKG